MIGRGIRGEDSGGGSGGRSWEDYVYYAKGYSDLAELGEKNIRQADTSTRGLYVGGPSPFFHTNHGFTSNGCLLDSSAELELWEGSILPTKPIIGWFSEVSWLTSQYWAMI